ncbi:GNAT family N-acetyltransferase [Cryobacterium sp. BB307]|uniref:GNAT family N-acetyltransferase n=1 Tax=Cryobacterium sp. BB307 TaxID=2716317 RepID=UPI001445D472|nr:GNAT family N-acetyltransferase [Cryobacterium sp. BB307]
MEDEFAIVRVPERNRFEMHEGDTIIGIAAYSLSGDRVTFTHTVMDDRYGGRGLGSRLAEFVLNDAAGSGKRIVPECSFISAYVRKHHDWDEYLEPAGTESR